ncbi:unnamed protein product [Chondrus crispus]|uniref:Uncharacterized protein n=1 Tax=Chondrus crispus TaxID=2769 RepID=R7QBR0_CHOCR|nr:unnamed protein product [Chondrus crispus]CDF34866.1 unnamed protein product [Chondrus crispus]|eukprot:XP_005714685.1 unnamed protein product [Chondrus crispus]
MGVTRRLTRTVVRQSRKLSRKVRTYRMYDTRTIPYPGTIRLLTLCPASASVSPLWPPQNLR